MIKHLLTIKFVAYQGAPTDFLLAGKKELIAKCPHIEWLESNFKPDIICFLSGGSEMHAIEYLHHGEMTLLLAGQGVNAWAAATEVKAYAGQNGLSARLVSADETQLEAVLIEYATAKTALLKIKSQRLGLIGEVSDWLIASSPTTQMMHEKFGIELVQLNYNELPDYLSFPADVQFARVFADLKSQQAELASISSFLKHIIAKHRLHAITIQCFKMVVEKKVTACLPVALINLNGIPAGCEGDLVSIVSIMLINTLVGEMPWMANLGAVNENTIFLSHCTLPLQLASSFEIDTHYETNISSSIRGIINMTDITIFRMNSKLDLAFVAQGKAISQPRMPHACRTQLEVEIDPADAVKLKNMPLGNHHIVIGGKHAALIKRALEMKNIMCI